jgi:3-oxoacyl-[acyl-carrier protein] reductase
LNAGIRGDNILGNYDWKQLDTVLATNLKAPIMVTNGIVRDRLFVEGKTSIIINGSVIGEDGQFGGGPYAASKAGLRGFVKTAAIELGRLYKIRVNLVEPGFIETELVDDLTTNPRMNRMMVGATPMGRLGVPDDVADMFVFLASDRSRFVSGAIHQVHGGINGYSAVAPLIDAQADIYSRPERRVVADFRAAKASPQQGGTA